MRTISTGILFAALQWAVLLQGAPVSAQSRNDSGLDRNRGHYGTGTNGSQGSGSTNDGWDQNNRGQYPSDNSGMTRGRGRPDTDTTTNRSGWGALNESCPTGYMTSERGCSDQERQRGCQDLRLPSGLGCVKK